MHRFKIRLAHIHTERHSEKSPNVPRERNRPANEWWLVEYEVYKVEMRRDSAVCQELPSLSKANVSPRVLCPLLAIVGHVNQMGKVARNGGDTRNRMTIVRQNRVDCPQGTEPQR